MPESSESGMPEDVGRHLRDLGLVVCHQVEDMIEGLARLAREKNGG